MVRLRQQHAGRPWVLHIWGLGCGPCLRGLPAWAQLVQRHPDLPLVLLQAERELSDTDRSLVEIFGSRLSIAFDNVILYRQLHEANTQLEERVARHGTIRTTAGCGGTASRRGSCAVACLRRRRGRTPGCRG